MSDVDPEELLAHMIVDRELPYIVRYAAMHDLISNWAILSGDADGMRCVCDVGLRIIKNGYHSPCVGHA